MPNDDKGDINDLIKVINNPQHETDIWLPGSDARDSKFKEGTEDKETRYE